MKSTRIPKTIYAMAATGLMLMAPRAEAGILSDIRHSISSLWSQKSGRQETAREARAKASATNQKAEFVHDRLEKTQQILLQANEYYNNYCRQVKRTEAQIVSSRHRRQLVTARYNRRRILFGRRLAAMQRMGKLGRLQLFLGSQTLSDLTRRVYVFNALAERDSELQVALREDKQELEIINNSLMAQWHERQRLRSAANKERERIVLAERDQQKELKALKSSTYAMLAYAKAQEQSSHEIDEMIGQLTARRESIIQSYEAEQARERSSYSRPRRTRRYRRVRVAHSVERVRYMRNPGGELKPMPVRELIYRDEMVPVEESGGNLSEGFSDEDDGVARHDDHDDGSWQAPVRGRISSRYGMRYHPILRRRKLHTGDDVAAPMGTPFRAARSGRVLWAGWKKAYGNTIIMDNGNGTTTLYGHASKLGVKAGQPVKRGEYIGNVGSTGWSTGPHLHFEVRKNGKLVDPTPYLRGKKH